MAVLVSGRHAHIGPVVHHVPGLNCAGERHPTGFAACWTIEGTGEDPDLLPDLSVSQGNSEPSGPGEDLRDADNTSMTNSSTGGPATPPQSASEPTTVSSFEANRVDGGEMQRRKRGLTASGASVDAGSVIPFPAGRTHVRPITETEEQPCGTGADDSPSSPRPRAGTPSPRKTPAKASAKTQRGRNSIGVLVPGLTLPKDMSGYRPQDVGLVTHAAIAIIAPNLRDLSPITLPEHVLDVCGALVNGENVSRRRVLMLTAAGHTANYLRRLAPTPPWDLLGCEFDTGGGRTDLAWQHSVTGEVFFDEVKTHNRSIYELSPKVVAQAKRQGDGGLAEFGPLFRGVRVLPFGALHLTTLVHPASKRHLIRPTPENPLALAVGGEGR